jgi:molybdate transport system substrate-binding protein
MQQIAAGFEKETGHKALLSTGATGKFYAQIKNGAPFHVLLAADDETPAKLEAEGLAVKGSRFTYAVGRLVLWSTEEGLVEEGGKVLTTDRFHKLAVANPKLAPYGAAAVEVLNRMGLLAAVEPKLVQGENIAQTHQFVASGNADLGFVALAQVWKDGKLTGGSGWVVPADLHAPIRQDAVLLTPGAESAAARALLKYLQGDAARAVIRSFGYDL